MCVVAATYVQHYRGHGAGPPYYCYTPRTLPVSTYSLVIPPSSALLKPGGLREGNNQGRSFNSELQVLHDRTGLVGKCTITIESPVRVQLDKSRLSTFIKSNSEWPALRIEKKGTFTDD